VTRAFACDDALRVRMRINARHDFGDSRDSMWVDR
jgi:hypothetical protein